MAIPGMFGRDPVRPAQLSDHQRMALDMWEAAAREFEPPTPRTDPLLLGGPATMGAALEPRKFVRRAHVDVLSQTWLDIAGGDLSRAAISLPSQVGKTTCAVDWAVFWWLCRNPTTRIAVASYNQLLAAERGRAVRQLVIDHGANYGLHLVNKADHAWTLTGGGGMLSVGIGAGFSGRPCDLLIVDDPHKDRAEADSSIMRKRVVDWWSGVAAPRLAPGAPVVVVQTRWHPDDLIGYLTKLEGTTNKDDGHADGPWRVVAMPAFATKPDDPLGRQPGEPLPHPKIREGDLDALTAHWELRRRTMTPRDFGAICQCDPQYATGALVTGDVLIACRQFDPNQQADAKRVAVAVDPSGGGRDTAGVMAGYLGVDDRMWLTHDRSVVGSSEKWSEAACLLAAEVDADMIIYESNFGGDMAATIMRGTWATLQRTGKIPPQRLCPRLQGVNAKRNKVLRAEPIAQAMRQDRVRTAQYLSLMEAEWLSYTLGDTNSPGRIDTSVYLGWGLLPLPSPGETPAADTGLLASTNLLSWRRG